LPINRKIARQFSTSKEGEYLRLVDPLLDSQLEKPFAKCEK